MVLFEFDRRALKVILARYLLIGLPIIFFSFFLLNTVYNKKKSDFLIQIEINQNNLVSLHQYQFLKLFQTSFDDLNVLANSDELTRFITESSDQNYSEAKDMFFRFLNSKELYLQLRFLSLDGDEVIRVDRNVESRELYERKNLQNKRNRYYFKSLENLSSGDLYISDFDLNVENGVIQRPYTPTIRFGIPVYDRGDKQGFLLINLDGFTILDLLKDIASKTSQDIEIGILDATNYLSLSSFDEDALLESSFFLNRGGGNPLYKQLNENNKDDISFIRDDLHYLYSNLSTTNENFTPFFDQISGTWFLISSFSESEMIKRYGDYFIQYKGIQYIILLIESFLLLLFVIFATQKETEHLLLLASGIISDFTHDGVLITNSNRKVIYCNPIFESIFGFKLSDIKGKAPSSFLKGDINPFLSYAKSGDVIWEGNIWDVTSENVHIQKYLRIRTVSTSTSKQIAYYIGIYSEPRNIPVIEDIYEKRELNMDYSPFIHESVKPLLAKVDLGENERKIVIALRIKEFSVLRSALTEEEENTLISNISLRVKKELSQNSAIIAPSSHMLFIALKTDDEPIDRVMERIDRAVNSIKFTDKMYSIDYVSGVSMAPEHGDDVNDLIQKANIALEAISRVKNSKYLLFDHNVFEEVNQYYKIKNQIDNAFINKEFYVVYQPQNNTKTNAIIGLEALVRWTSSTLGPVYPSTFVPIMEEDSTQIKKLGKYILKKVVRECKHLISNVSSDFRISINLSSQEFVDISIIKELVSQIQTEEFPLQNISFEITETVLSDNLDFTNSIIEILHHNNITVAIDDFGTGYSSLGYLKKLNTDKLKVDRIFIKDYPENDDGSILKAIAKLAHELNMKIIVEGVETEIQRQFIMDLGCHEYQGYFCSKPVAIAEITKLLDL